MVCYMVGLFFVLVVALADWKGGNLAEQLGTMVEHPNQSQPNHVTNQSCRPVEIFREEKHLVVELPPGAGDRDVPGEVLHGRHLRQRVQVQRQLEARRLRREGPRQLRWRMATTRVSVEKRIKSSICQRRSGRASWKSGRTKGGCIYFTTNQSQMGTRGEGVKNPKKVWTSLMDAPLRRRWHGNPCRSS